MVPIKWKQNQTVYSDIKKLIYSKREDNMFKLM